MRMVWTAQLLVLECAGHILVTLTSNLSGGTLCTVELRAKAGNSTAPLYLLTGAMSVGTLGGRSACPTI